MDDRPGFDQIHQAKAVDASAQSGDTACPACGSNQVVPVVYGVLTSGLLESYAAGRVALGGVRESSGSPQWRCRACDRTWADDAQGPAGSR